MTSGRRVGVVGDPVEHSISPAMQQPALDVLGISATYERWHTPLATLPERIASLRERDVLGANVTVPHKENVLSLIDEVSNLARRAGAVNTISNRDGRLAGDNTDVYGLSQSLRLHDDRLDGCRAVVLGAGGAARAAVLSLEGVGAPRGSYSTARSSGRNVFGTISYQCWSSALRPDLLRRIGYWLPRMSSSMRLHSDGNVAKCR
ncbi:MAG: hypothetical protein M9947_05245 [Thermomicrobiales bacterium]|nr:hypothetical protein [Thermomicrobiales bacterium]